MDWTGCTLVECDPEKLGGVPVVKGTRTQAANIVGNFEIGSPFEEISENIGIPESTTRELLAFAAAQSRSKPGSYALVPIPFPGRECISLISSDLPAWAQHGIRCPATHAEPEVP